ncbi:MAG: Asp-tRNA(Asn)/Glu-tRNA(Gln) amidotransferase subunit GatC [Candidatus Omnitrophica bacterium]|nr:Asp-tRNA(Asn)/Glu-tRNA(Gln) amidotransferase subunit GatC [Candidatus Omnitrophota bacterium]
MEFNIDRIAELARLNLKSGEKEKLEKDLESILGYVKKLESLETSQVEPTSHVLDLENVFRPDTVKSTEIQEEVLEHAPSRHAKFFKVPKVVEKE